MPEVDDDDDAQEFKETPTESNRLRTLAAEAAADAEGMAGPGSPGVYRMLRPSVTDVIEPPCVVRPEPPAVTKRTVIGAARIRR